MIRQSIFVFSIAFIGAVLSVPTSSETRPADHNWIDTSNQYTQMLLAIEFKHHPEGGSRQGLSEYDTKISQPSWADEDQRRKEIEEVLEKLKAAAGQQQQKEVEQDLQIIIRRVELDFKEEDFDRAHDVPFFNASREVF